MYKLECQQSQTYIILHQPPNLSQHKEQGRSNCAGYGWIRFLARYCLVEMNIAHWALPVDHWRYMSDCTGVWWWVCVCVYVSDRMWIHLPPGKLATSILSYGFEESLATFGAPMIWGSNHQNVMPWKFLENVTQGHLFQPLVKTLVKQWNISKSCLIVGKGQPALWITFHKCLPGCLLGLGVVNVAKL